MTTVHAIRTDAEPMAFTGKEFARGAFAAWLTFMVLLLSTLIVTAILESGEPWGSPLSMIFVYLVYGIPIGALVSAVVALLMSPVAWAIGRGLRRQPRLLMHLAAYLLLGAAIGLLLVFGSAVVSRGDVGELLSNWFPWFAAAACAVSVAAGWAWTVRQAVRERDRRLARAHVR